MAARKYLGGLAIAAFALSPILAVAPAFAVSDSERVAVYKQFLVDYQAKRYAEAQPLAEQLVKLTEEQYGPDELQLTNPLTNLATIHYKLGNYPAAIENYQRTLRILQAKSTNADKQQIRPLHGLGVSFLGARDPESAVVALKRAADLSRNNDGLFNIGQVEFIDALIDAYESTGRFAESEKEAGYALRVEEAAYGRNSVKLLDRLDKLALWFENDRRYTSERNTYERSLAILQKSGAANDLRRIPPLRGIARSFRLEAFYGIEGADNGATFNTGNNGAPVFADGTQQRRGESSLTTALQIIESSQPVDPVLRGVVLTDLGDWYLVANNTRRAYDTYAEAWKSLNDARDTKLLEWPRVLAYRPSVSSVDRSQLDPKEAQLKAVELHFTVTRDGRLENVSSPTTDVPEGIVRNSVTSMRRSRYAPRIENGAAVATNDVVFVERVLIRATSPESGTSSGKAAEKPPEPPAPIQQEEAPKTEEAPK
jgi:tetratricopeptide (TPR) repeat protein